MSMMHASDPAEELSFLTPTPGQPRQGEWGVVGPDGRQYAEVGDSLVVTEPVTDAPTHDRARTALGGTGVASVQPELPPWLTTLTRE